MNTSPYVESRRQWHFDANWKVVRFDATPWFRFLTGLGLKGMDFLLMREGRIYWLEAKNFEQRAGAPAPKIPEGEELVAQLEAKLVDSRRLLGVIVASLRRHFLYRLWAWAVRLGLPLRWLQPEWSFWTEALEALEYGRETPVLALLCWPPGKPLPLPDYWLLLEGDGPFECLPGVILEAQS